jgi:hypothetical protein
MKHIKKFNEGLEDHIIDGERTDGDWGKGKYAKAHHFADRLKDGFAINISKDDVDKFFDILKDITWIELPKSSEHYTNSRYYFVLFGDRLLHSDKPYFGGNELEVYTPSI